MKVSIEQMVRDILEQAIKDGLVSLSKIRWVNPDPQCRSAGELVGPANILTKHLYNNKQANA